MEMESSSEGRKALKYTYAAKDRHPTYGSSGYFKPIFAGGSRPPKYGPPVNVIYGIGTADVKLGYTPPPDKSEIEKIKESAAFKSFVAAGCDVEVRGRSIVIKHNKGSLEEEKETSVKEDICTHPAFIRGMCLKCGEKMDLNVYNE